jgi:hypothetical protein
MILGLLDPDPNPEFICTDPDPSINKQKNEEKPCFLLFCDFFYFLSLKNDVNVHSKRNKHKNLREKKKILFFVGILKVTDEKSGIRSQIRIR